MKLSSIFTGVKGLGLSFAFGAVLVGCAVLTVDVDVYKGALVNEEEVQLHQLVALATAAKPMLLQLRDILEWPHTDGKPYAEDEDNHKTCSKEYKKIKDWYRSKYVSLEEEDYLPVAKPRSGFQQMTKWITEAFTGPSPSCQPHFEDPYARSVNIVLSLYEDIDSTDLYPYGKKIREAVGQLRRAQNVYELDKQRDQEIFDAISKGLKQKTDLGSKLLQDLLDTYKNDLLDPPGEIPGKPIRRVDNLMDIFTKLAQEDKNQPKSTLESILIDNWKGSLTYHRSQLYDQKLSFRAVWKLLGDKNGNVLISGITRKLCIDGKPGDDACKRLKERTKQLADAYWDVRLATRELWEETLGLLVRIDRLERERPGLSHALKEKVIKLISKTTDPVLIASALDRLGENGTCSVLGSTLLREWKRICEGDLHKMAWTTRNVDGNRAYFRRVLEEALSSASADTAHFLLTLDSLEKDVPPKNSEAQTLVKEVNQTNSSRMVRLGLIVSYITGSEERGWDELKQITDEVNRDLANGLGRGRLSNGLHTLTENYLQLHNGAKNAVDINEQKQLLESLVEFAQKILFLANHEGLSSPPGTSGLILGGAEKFTRGLLGDSITDHSFYGLLGEERADARKKRYVRVLQAVGNSILFSANELRERERHREQGEKKVAAEVMAARSVYSPDPAKVLTDLLIELEHDKQVAQTALDDANTRKPTIDEQTETLTNEQRTASHKLAEITRKIDDYQREFTPVESTYQVLLHYVSNEDKEKWKTSWGKIKSDPDKFLASDGESLGSKLQVARPGVTSPAKDEDSKFSTAISYIKLPDTKNAFKEYLKPFTITKQSELLDRFITYIKKLENERREQIAGYKTEHDVQKGEIDRANGKIVRLKAEAKQISELPKKIDRLETARTEIASVQGGVLKEAEAFKEAKGGIPFVSPETIYSLIRSHLEKKPTDSSQTAQTVLLSRTAPPGMPPPDPNSYKSPIEVMDTVIALLRHRHMEVVERFGEGSPEGKKATEALENAYGHRAGMIYIRPSSAYLRTSFPSTSLQDDPNLAWDNMLLKQGLRNLPFSSELRDILNPSVKQDQVLTSELDKQYWQNINRVRVSGAGRTNQALVKDDVGNWYVKQYFGDTKRIWESAKNLALFSMSAKVPIDLAKQLNKASSPEEYAENSKESPTLQKVLERHQRVYKTHTEEIQANLDRLHDKELKETLIAAWDAHKNLKEDVTVHDALGQALEAEITVWNKAATAMKGKADQDPGQVIVKDVGALSRLGRMLSASITKIIMQEEKELEGKQKTLAEKLGKETLDAKKTELETKKTELEKKRKIAVFEVRKVVGGQVTDILTDRNRVLDQYEQAIVFIGDAANPKDSK